MSSISAGTTSGTALVSSGDTTGELQLRVNGTKAELPKELAGATELLDFLVASNVISQASATKILE